MPLNTVDEILQRIKPLGLSKEVEHKVASIVLDAYGEGSHEAYLNCRAMLERSSSCTTKTKLNA